MAESIRLERDGAVASIVLDSGELNLFDATTFPAVVEAIAEVSASDARALVWRAEGETFSAGVDVNGFVEAAEAGNATETFRPLVEGVRSLEALPIPTLALTHGLCLTAGLEVALGCDLMWAAEGTRFGLVEAVVGLTPGAGGTQRMVARAGPARAREFVMTGGLYPAETFLEWGVLNRVLPREQLLEKGMRFAERLAAGPTLAHAATKRIVQAAVDGGVESADEITPEVFGGLFETGDAKAAFTSFVEDGPGKASFEGR